MFSVIFEVHPKPEQWDGYLANAKMLRPDLDVEPQQVIPG